VPKALRDPENLRKLGWRTTYFLRCTLHLWKGIDATRKLRSLKATIPNSLAATYVGGMKMEKLAEDRTNICVISEEFEFITNFHHEYGARILFL